MSTSTAAALAGDEAIEKKVSALLERMTLSEKIGQMTQVDAGGIDPVAEIGERLRAGRLGSVLNQVDVEAVNELQRIAVEESRLGIPLLVGRDVVHGFHTVFPIPLGQAATWNPPIVQNAARAAAVEASRAGVNWTFAPMIDISRDARWGRIAESFGEDPYLTAALGVATVRGFQTDDLSSQTAVAVSAKHFAGYGASEGGRDYAATNIPANELRNVYLPPFEAVVNAGAVSLMASFGDIDGIPATANQRLLRDILRDEWGFDGILLSDWNAIEQLKNHGLTRNSRQSAREAVIAGVDMEMASSTYINHLPELVEQGDVSVSEIDGAVSNILRAKFRLGLFDDPYTRPEDFPAGTNVRTLELAKRVALQSIVLVKNENRLLPLDAEEVNSVAVIGPLADAPYEQLGTWIFDGDPALSITPLDAISSIVGDAARINYIRAMETSRSRDTDAFDAAAEAAAGSDVAILLLGEESILSGEAHSRADIELPGAQNELIRRLSATNTPLVAVILAGRPLALSRVAGHLDAILYAWHPGTMAGPAIADLLFGAESPSGKLPVTFPAVGGQIPIYYNHKNSGRPPNPEEIVHIDDIDAHAPQTSLGMTSFYLDAGFLPQWPFGHGLTYTEFEYSDLQISTHRLESGASLVASIDLTNCGDRSATEVVQLYIRDVAASVTRPVRELKGFRRVTVRAGETLRVDFELGVGDLAFYGRDQTLVVEPGEFQIWVGGSSTAQSSAVFELVD